MKIARLLYSLLNEPWFIDERYLVSHLPQLFAAAKGDKEALEARAASIFYYVDQYGRERSPFYDNGPEPGSVAVISVHGMMLKNGGYYSWGADELVQFMKIAASSVNVAAIVLDIDTGGGMASSIPVYDEYFSMEDRKPVIAYADTAASAGYYLAAKCDVIIAANDFTSAFGSIGVMTSYMNVKKYFEAMGIEMKDIYADQSVHKNEISRALEQGDEQPLKDRMLNPLAARFMKDVKTLRPNLKEEEGVLTGRMFQATEALRLGMIDAIGTRAEAIARARTLATLRSV